MEVRDIAENLAEANLRQYAGEIRSTARLFNRKEINDAIWGTITLFPVEVAVLDSPLLQRLRSIRQLGVVHWVYPGAVHTRFEHTLGVLFQVQHLMSALNTLGAQRGHTALISSDYQQLLRLAALVHDVGHAAFSHVSELALENLPEINPIAAEFSHLHHIEKKKLSEIFAFYVIHSKAMKEFLGVLLDHVGFFAQFSERKNENLDLIVEKLGRLIIGQKIDDRLPLLHEFISGPFDADKLDYFVRDARLAGTPCVLDISRLVQKISIREFDAADLPGAIATSVSKIDSKHCLFGIKWSGVAVLDELHLARVLLYSKIYRHPKVVAIEQMLCSSVLMLAKLVPPEIILRLMYNYEDETLLSMTREGLAAALGLRFDDLNCEQVEILTGAFENLRDIKARRLVVKAFQIERHYPADPLENDDIQKSGLTTFREDLEHPQNREQFRNALRDEIASILQLVPQDMAPAGMRLDGAIMVHTLGNPQGGTEIARAYLLPATGRPMAFRDYPYNRAALADSYLSNLPVGYVFAPPSVADVVFVAVEMLARVRYEVRLPETALEASKRDARRIDSLKRQLADAGYYRKAPHDIRPLPICLGMADVTVAIDRFAELLAGYQEPQIEGVGRSAKSVPPKERIFTWLRQFDNDGYIDCALKLLDRFRMIGRVETVAAIKAFVDANPAFRGGVVVPFGSARDSGAVHSYFAADLIDTYISGCKTFAEAVKAGGSCPIIFIDDIVSSGGQGQDILAAGFDMPWLRKDLNEQRDLFDGDTQSHLKSVKLAFVFTAAWEKGIIEFKKAVKKIGLEAEVFHLISEGQIPFAFDKPLIDVDPKVQAAFQQRCREIGVALLDATHDMGGHGSLEAQRKKVTDRSLGYGNRGMLLASPINVPTQTLTLVWGEGDVDGVQWTPLMRRRKKV